MIKPDYSELPEGCHGIEGFLDKRIAGAFVFDEGFALELLHVLRADGWEHWPVPVMCGHCSNWLTSLEADGDLTGYFCHCCGIWLIEKRKLSQQEWHRIRSRALKLWQQEQTQEQPEEDLEQQDHTP